MNVKKMLAILGVATALCATTASVSAQPMGGGPGGFRGRFNPEQMRERMMQAIRDRMGVTNDAEWSVIQTRVQKVLDARRDAGPMGFGPMMFRGRRGGPNGNGNGGPPRGRFGAPNPALDALDNAIDSNVPTDQLKDAMDKYRADHKEKEAALEKAQADLKSVLTVKQEAVALSMGLVN